MGERHYRCHGCNRGFRDASDRKRHVKTHRGEEAIKNVFDFILNKEYTGCPRTRGSNLQCVFLGDN
jgi:hypothetical protein